MIVDPPAAPAPSTARSRNCTPAFTSRTCCSSAADALQIPAWRTTSPVARVAPETRVPVHDVHRGAQEAGK
jgi:hypothetical protein